MELLPLSPLTSLERIVGDDNNGITSSYEFYQLTQGPQRRVVVPGVFKAVTTRERGRSL